MKKVLELLLNAKNSTVILYYSGSQFVGTIENIAYEEVITLKCDNQTIFLDGKCLIGFSYLSQNGQQLEEISEKKVILEEMPDTQKEKGESKLQLFEKRLHELSSSEASVMDLIIENVRNRAQKYPNIKIDIEKVIQQIGNCDSEGVDEDLLLLLEQLKGQNPGCHSALDTLIAGCHYAGSNKEKAIQILWNVQRYEIALMIIREIWSDAIYLDCLGYVISDLDVVMEGLSKNLFYSYVQKCAETGDVSLLVEIMEDSFQADRFVDELFYCSLYYLIIKKEKDAEIELNFDINILVLIRKVKQLYPGNGMLLDRQNTLKEQLDRLFANAPIRIKEKKKTASARYTDEVHKMKRLQYYIGIVDEGFMNDGYRQFRVKLNPDQSERIYMHPYQIADPLLLHKLNTYKNIEGTKILFRFGNNGKGICVADAVMPYKDRAAYYEDLFENKKSDYEMPPSFKYLSDQFDEEELSEYGKTELEKASKEAQKENIDQAEMIIFFYNCIMNKNSWSGMGYPDSIQNCSELIEYLDNYKNDDDNDQIKWADGMMRIMRQTEHNDWANIFRSVREGLSQSSPLYVKSKVDPAEVSSEELQNAYIFPEAANGNYEDALHYIEYWKKKMIQKRKNSGGPWLRMCKLQEVCQAGLDKNDEVFTKRALELSDLVTDTQKKKLALLFEMAGIYGGGE